MSHYPLVSVIIPTYNRAHVVGRAIDSVLNQDYPQIETLVVDDGSTDETATRLSSYGDRIRVLVQKNSGPSVARNRGIAEARGALIAFLDSDDYWLPSKISRQVQLLNQAGPDTSCCLCNCTVVYNDGSRSSAFDVSEIIPESSPGLWVNPTEVLSTRFVLFNQAVLVRREALDRAGFYDERLQFFCEDYELALRLSLEGPWVLTREELVVQQDASPDSLGQRALRQEALFRENLLYMRERVLTLIESGSRNSRLEQIGRWQLWNAKRELASARLRSGSSPIRAAMARCLDIFGRICQAGFRRSPLHPHVVVRQLV